MDDTQTMRKALLDDIKTIFDIDNPADLGAITLMQLEKVYKAGAQWQSQQAQGAETAADLLDEYWDTAYNEGAQGVDFDRHGRAHEVRSALENAYRHPPAPAAVPEAGILIEIAAQLLDGRWASECIEDWPENTGPECAAKRAEVDQERRRKMAVSLRSFWDSLGAPAPAEPDKDDQQAEIFRNSDGGE